MKKNNKHYSLANILAEDAQYNLLYGERSNGKSYAVKVKVLKDVFNDINRKKFVYVRRWREDVVSNRAEGYFDDMELDDEGNERVTEITKGAWSCISIYRSEIYFATRDENGKKLRGPQIGRVCVLTGDTHEKSFSYVGYYNIVFEEMITDKGYLAGEVKTFMSLVSTIFRRRQGKVFLIGNTLTKTCPYFREWELINVPKQAIGSIDIYTYKTGETDEDGSELIIKIAVEYCSNARGVTKMIFGNKMITKGEWATDEKEHLPLLYGNYTRHLQILIADELELFVIDVLSYENRPFAYVRDVEKKWTEYEKYDIVITNRFHHDMKYVKSLDAFPKLRKFIRWLFDSGNVCYKDNLVGTTFTSLLNNRKIF